MPPGCVARITTSLAFCSIMLGSRFDACAECFGNRSLTQDDLTARCCLFCIACGNRLMSGIDHRGGFAEGIYGIRCLRNARLKRGASLGNGAHARADFSDCRGDSRNARRCGRRATTQTTDSRFGTRTSCGQMIQLIGRGLCTCAVYNDDKTRCFICHVIISGCNGVRWFQSIRKVKPDLGYRLGAGRPKDCHRYRQHQVIMCAFACAELRIAC